jgi:hypothetical protein
LLTWRQLLFPAGIKAIPGVVAAMRASAATTRRQLCENPAVINAGITIVAITTVIQPRRTKSISAR